MPSGSRFPPRSGRRTNRCRCQSSPCLCVSCPPKHPDVGHIPVVRSVYPIHRLIGVSAAGGALGIQLDAALKLQVRSSSMRLFRSSVATTSSYARPAFMTRYPPLHALAHPLYPEALPQTPRQRSPPNLGRLGIRLSPAVAQNPADRTITNFDS